MHFVETWFRTRGLRCGYTVINESSRNGAKLWSRRCDNGIETLVLSGAFFALEKGRKLICSIANNSTVLRLVSIQVSNGKFSIEDQLDQHHLAIGETRARSVPDGRLMARVPAHAFDTGGKAPLTTAGCWLFNRAERRRGVGIFTLLSCK